MATLQATFHTRNKDVFQANHMGHSCCLISQELKVLQRRLQLLFYDRSQKSCQEPCHTVRWARERPSSERGLVELPLISQQEGSFRLCLQNIA